MAFLVVLLPFKIFFDHSETLCTIPDRISKQKLPYQELPLCITRTDNYRKTGLIVEELYGE